MVSPTVFYKLLVPLLRCEVQDMRDSVVQAFGRINHVAIMDLMSEVWFILTCLFPYLFLVEGRGAHTRR